MANKGIVAEKGSKVFLSAEWCNLLMANYAVDLALLKKYVPCRTELDDYNGAHYVSLVGFLFRNTKVRGISFPFHTTFEEVNLRFYVRYREGNSWKRGVVFMKEIVPRKMISFIANTLYGENYVNMPMRHNWQHKPEHFEVAYEWKWKGEWNWLKASAANDGYLADDTSEEAFITEHYWGYTLVNNACTGVYQVKHPKWKVHKVYNFEAKVNAAALYGAGFETVLSQEPASVFLAEGSPVEVLKGSKLYKSEA